jgi:hypothetical protein
VAVTAKGGWHKGDVPLCIGREPGQVGVSVNEVPTRQSRSQLDTGGKRKVLGKEQQGSPR